MELIQPSHRATYDSTVRLAEESEAPIYSVDYDTSGRGILGHGMPLPGGGNRILGLPIASSEGVPGTPGGATTGDYRAGRRVPARTL